MSSRTRKVDAKSRVVLPDDFAGKTVTLERLAQDEVRIRLAKAPRPRPAFDDLMAAMADAELPAPVDFGPPVGKELL